MEDICQQIPVIPQSKNMGTCWFNAILTCCLYSDGLSAIIFQKAIEDNWCESGSVIKIYMYNVLSYLYAIKNGKTDLIKSLERYLNTYRPELLLLSYANEYDTELFEQKNLIFTGNYTYYFEIFLKNMGIETGNNVKIINSIFFSNLIKLDCIVISTIDYKHIISLLTCNSIGYVYDGYEKKCKLMMFDWKMNKNKFKINYDNCSIVTNHKFTQKRSEIFHSIDGSGCAISIENIPIITKKFRGIKFTELRMTNLLKNINFDDIDDITELEHIYQILGLKHNEKNIDKLRLDIKTEYNKLLVEGFFKSITLGSKDELSIELKDVLDEDLSLIPIDKKVKMIELTINNLLKITENESYKSSLNKILIGLKNKNQTKLKDRYLYLRRKAENKNETKVNMELFISSTKHIFNTKINETNNKRCCFVQ